MTTDTELQNQSLNLDVELAQAFADKLGQQQQEAGDEQQNSGEVEYPDSSSSSSGTTPSSSDTQPLTKEQFLASLTLEDIKRHPELSKQLQSETDKVAAEKLKGTRAQIESQLRSQINLEVAARHFESLSQSDLAEELANNPQAAVMYSHVQASRAQQPDPKVQAQVEQWSREIRTTDARLNNSGLDDKTIAELNPNIYLVQPGRNPDELLEEWKSKVEDAIIEAKVAKKLGTITKTDSKAKELDSQASGLNSSVDPLLTNGTRAAPRKDFMTTRSDILLADAFAETSRNRR